MCASRFSIVIEKKSTTPTAERAKGRRRISCRYKNKKKSTNHGLVALPIPLSHLCDAARGREKKYSEKDATLLQLAQRRANGGERSSAAARAGEERRSKGSLNPTSPVACLFQSCHIFSLSASSHPIHRRPNRVKGKKKQIKRGLADRLPTRNNGARDRLHQSMPVAAKRPTYQAASLAVRHPNTPGLSAVSLFFRASLPQGWVCFCSGLIFPPSPSLSFAWLAAWTAGKSKWNLSRRRIYTHARRQKSSQVR